MHATASVIQKSAFVRSIDQNLSRSQQYSTPYSTALCRR